MTQTTRIYSFQMGLLTWDYGDTALARASRFYILRNACGRMGGEAIFLQAVKMKPDRVPDLGFDFRFCRAKTIAELLLK